MRKNPLHKAFLILVLALSQWLVVAHALEHPAYQSTEQYCQIGLHAQGLDSGAVVPADFSLPTFVAADAPFIVIAAQAASIARRAAPIRGPPLLV